MKRIMMAASTAMLCLVAAQAEECASLKALSRVQLTPHYDGHAEYVPVDLAGEHKSFLLDTGATTSIVREEAIAGLHLKPHEAPITIYDVTGRKSEKFVTVPLSLGRLHTDKAELMLESPDVPGSRDIDGILGANILSHYDISVDFGTHNLDIIDQDHCEGRVIYWPERPVAIVPFRLLPSGHVVIKVNLDGHDLEALVDTGATNSVLMQPNAEQEFGLVMGAADTPLFGKLNGDEKLDTWSHRFKALNLEGLAVSNTDIEIIPDRVSAKLPNGYARGSHLFYKDEQSKYALILGMDVLKHLRVYIAYKEKKLYISPASKPAGETPAPKTN